MKIDNAHIKQVLHFYLLESKITEDGRSKADILSKITQAKKAFQVKFIYRTLIVRPYNIKQEVPESICVDFSPIWL